MPKTIDDYEYGMFAPNLSSVPPAAQNSFTDPVGSQTIVGTPATAGQIQPKRTTIFVTTSSTDTTVTPPIDTADIVEYVTTLGSGTLTVGQPIGKPQNGQTFILKIRATNAQTYSWNAIYRGSTTLSLPTTTSSGLNWDYLAFSYDSTDEMWDLLAYVNNF